MTESGSLNDRIQSRRGVATTGTVPDDDPEACDDWGTFGILRGNKERAVMLDLRLKNGQREAFAYALLERVSFDPSEGLTLRFLGSVVKLTGRHLTRPTSTGVNLLEALHRHRVIWIAELDEVQSWTSTSDVPLVTGILLPPTKSST